MKAPRPSLRRRRQGGITLIEVMIGILVFSFGLLGLVGLQARATAYSVIAEDSNRAALLANEVAATMLTSNTVTLDEEVLEAWNARVGDATASGLPNGVGEVTVDSGVATILVSWRSPNTPATTPDHRYQTQVVIP